MSDRKSKNSPVEGFVIVQSGSGSFFGLFVRGRRLDNALLDNRRNKTNIDTSILNMSSSKIAGVSQKINRVDPKAYINKYLNWVRCNDPKVVTLELDDGHCDRGGHPSWDCGLARSKSVSLLSLHSIDDFSRHKYP
jgi:hypothetical protein